MPLVHRHTEVPPGTEECLAHVLQRLTGLSRAQIRGLIDHQCVRVDERVCASDFERVQPGEHVSVHYDPQRRYRPTPAWHEAAFRLVHEDQHLLVVDKTAAVLTVPTPRHESDTLVHALQRYLNRGSSGRRRVEVVHRLDRGVSGLLVFAKNRTVAQHLRRQFALRKPEREYVALVAGHMAEPQGTFRSRLLTSSTLRRYSSSRPATAARQSGEMAVTHYRAEQRLPGATRVCIRIDTGRRNQIRVHFAEAGHPVLGDRRYGADQAEHPRWRARRLALHATVLGFVHPVSGLPLRFASPLPAEFERFLKP